jgi:hypothetical protein
MVSESSAILTYEAACPYCGFPNEFPFEVAATRPVDMPDHLRRYLVAAKLLGWQGNTLRADVAAYKHRVAKATAALERCRSQLGPTKQKRWWRRYASFAGRRSR